MFQLAAWHGCLCIRASAVKERAVAGKPCIRLNFVVKKTTIDCMYLLLMETMAVREYCGLFLGSP